MPSEGWGTHPKEGSLFSSRLGNDRKRLLKLNALLVLRLPVPCYRQDGTFEWIRAPQAEGQVLDEATWYMDGSMLLGKWSQFRTTGFGLAVVSKDGDLLAFGLGQPPSWCTTAAAAEAWVLLLVLNMTVQPPNMRTDCLSLITTAQAGVESATAAHRPLARIWSQIAMTMDGSLQALCNHDNLVWQPAHLAPTAIGVAKLSNGRRLSPVDWRANRLVDALAKKAASRGLAPNAVIRALEGSSALVTHAALVLGRSPTWLLIMFP